MRSAALALLIAAAACDPVMVVRGTVRSPPPAACAPAIGGDVYAGSRPLEGATIELRCPGGDRPHLTATSDADGRFRTSSIGTFGDECTIRVAHPGYHVLEIPVAGLCAFDSSMGCHFAAVSAELIPITSR